MNTAPTFKVRTTTPGRKFGLKEWAREELAPIIASYKQRYPDAWRRYLNYESKKGFITNAMNDHIMVHLAEAVPGLHPMHYRTGVVDFRFANNEDFHFSMWLPKYRDRRAAAYAAHLKEMHNNHQSPYVNGRAEWADNQINLFIAHLQEKAPELWERYCELYNNIGFEDPPTRYGLHKQVPMVFPVPEDIDYFSIRYGLLDEANRRYGFEMTKPENEKKQHDLWTQCHKAWQTHHIPFDEWYRTILDKRREEGTP